MADRTTDIVGPLIAVPASLFTSKVWRSLGVTAPLIMAYVLAEDRRWDCACNGALHISYDALVAAGCTRELIPAALNELESYGLLTCLKSRRNRRRTKTYRLPFFPSWDGKPAVYGWENVSDELIAKISPRKGRRSKTKVRA